MTEFSKATGSRALWARILDTSSPRRRRVDWRIVCAAELVLVAIMFWWKL